MKENFKKQNAYPKDTLIKCKNSHYQQLAANQVFRSVNALYVNLNNLNAVLCFGHHFVCANMLIKYIFYCIVVPHNIFIIFSSGLMISSPLSPLHPILLQHYVSDTTPSSPLPLPLSSTSHHLFSFSAHPQLSPLFSAQLLLPSHLLLSSYLSF